MTTLFKYLAFLMVLASEEGGRNYLRHLKAQEAKTIAITITVEG